MILRIATSTRKTINEWRHRIYLQPNYLPIAWRASVWSMISISILRRFNLLRVVNYLILIVKLSSCESSLWQSRYRHLDALEIKGTGSSNTRPWLEAATWESARSLITSRAEWERMEELSQFLWPNVDHHFKLKSCKLDIIRPERFQEWWQSDEQVLSGASLAREDLKSRAAQAFNSRALLIATWGDNVFHLATVIWWTFAKVVAYSLLLKLTKCRLQKTRTISRVVNSNESVGPLSRALEAVGGQWKKSR